jgi:hypothetical protein
MKRTGFLLMFVLAIGCSGVTFQEFSPDGKFKVLMPGTPKDSSKTEKGVQVKIWASQAGRSGALLTSVTELPVAAVDAGQADEVLDEAAKAQMAGMGATGTKSTKIMLNNKYPGRAVDGTISPQGTSGTASSRIYLVKNRLYQLLALGEGAFANSADSTKFFDSFQIISE